MSEQMKVWAHEFAMAVVSNPTVTLDRGNLDNITENAWAYAEAMQSKADEQEEIECKTKCEKARSILNDNGTFVEREGQHFDDVASVCNTYINPKEWQPDWSKAPKWANYFVARTCDGLFFDGMWSQKKPEIIDGYSDELSHWSIPQGQSEIVLESFGYSGDWRKSLRKRPE